MYASRGKSLVHGHDLRITIPPKLQLRIDVTESSRIFLNRIIVVVQSHPNGHSLSSKFVYIESIFFVLAKLRRKDITKITKTRIILFAANNIIPTIK